MSEDRTITLSLEPKADALLGRIAEAEGKTKAEVAAAALSSWLAATLDRLDNRAAIEAILEEMAKDD